MNKNIIRTALVVALLAGTSAGLSACMTAPLDNGQPDMSFAQMQPIGLNVAKIEVFDEYRQPATGNYIEQEFNLPPAAAARRLIESKLVANGTRQVLRVFIDDASVLREDLKVREDLMGNFTRETSEKYRGRVALRFELVNEEAPDIIVGHANVISDRTSSLMENTSLAERDRVYMALTEGLMNDLYAGFQTTVRNTFGGPR